MNRYYVIATFLLDNQQHNRCFCFNANAVVLETIDMWRNDIAKEFKTSVKNVMILSWQKLDA